MTKTNWLGPFFASLRDTDGNGRKVDEMRGTALCAYIIYNFHRHHHRHSLSGKCQNVLEFCLVVIYI